MNILIKNIHELSERQLLKQLSLLKRYGKLQLTKLWWRLPRRLLRQRADFYYQKEKIRFNDNYHITQASSRAFFKQM